MVESCLSLQGLEFPVSTHWLNTHPGPLCSTCWSNKGREGWQGSLMRRKDGDVRGNISNLAL